MSFKYVKFIFADFPDRTPAERLILFMVRACGKKGLMFSNQDIADRLSVTPRHVSDVINLLFKEGLVKIKNPKTRHRRIYYVENPEVEKDSTTSKIRKYKDPSIRKIPDLLRGNSGFTARKFRNCNNRSKEFKQTNDVCLSDFSIPEKIKTLFHNQKSYDEFAELCKGNPDEMERVIEWGSSIKPQNLPGFLLDALRKGTVPADYQSQKQRQQNEQQTEELHEQRQQEQNRETYGPWIREAKPEEIYKKWDSIPSLHKLIQELRPELDPPKVLLRGKNRSGKT
jgi:transcription initiation factor IIE alpha subunit